LFFKIIGKLNGNGAIEASIEVNKDVIEENQNEHNHDLYVTIRKGGGGGEGEGGGYRGGGVSGGGGYNGKDNSEGNRFHAIPFVICVSLGVLFTLLIYFYIFEQED